MDDAFGRWRGALAGELVWLTAGGQVGGMAVVPLELNGMPCVALPYAVAPLVASVREAPVTAFVVSDGRSRRGAGAVISGPVRVVDDLEGTTFVTDLLPTELRKHPPSRALAGSLLLRRENWWWLPRIIVSLSAVHETYDIPRRKNPATDGILAYRAGDRLRVNVVTADDWSAPRIAVEHPTETEGRTHEPVGLPPTADGEPALVMGHDYSVPDFDRWETWTLRGVLRGGELLVADRSGEPGQPLGPLRLRARLRRHRALERACRAGIAAAERAAR